MEIKSEKSNVSNKITKSLERLEELLKSTFENLPNIVTPPNLISLSRPIIAWYSLENFMDQPIYLSLALAGASLTNLIDGMMARHLKKDGRVIGAYADIFGDRAMELITFWSFANEGMIPYAIPIIFTAKGLVVDSLRIYRDMRREDFSKPLSYGKNDSRPERFAYAVVKGAYMSGVPILGEIFNNAMGVATTAFGLYRGIRSVVNK